MIKRMIKYVRHLNGALGTTYLISYLVERLVRRRLRPSGWNALESRAWCRFGTGSRHGRVRGGAVV